MVKTLPGPLDQAQPQIGCAGVFVQLGEGDPGNEAHPLVETSALYLILECILARTVADEDEDGAGDVGHGLDLFPQPVVGEEAALIQHDARLDVQV